MGWVCGCEGCDKAFRRSRKGDYSRHLASQHKDFSHKQEAQVCVFDRVHAGAPGTGRVANDDEQAQYRVRPAKEQAMIDAEKKRRQGAPGGFP